VPVALAAAVLLAIVVTSAALLRARHAGAAASAAPSSNPPALTASAASEPAPPAVSASADPPPSPAAVASEVPSSVAASPPTPFERAKAQAALDTAAADAAQCKLPRGYTCQVKVTYAPNGHVQSAAALKRCAGTAVGACVASRLKAATIEPFAGKPTPYIYTYAPAKTSPSK
jgi:hypothetical protein